MLNIKTYRKPLRKLLHFPINIWGQLIARQYDMNNTILLVATGRGGSTWLAEIIHTIPNYMVLFEPLNPKYNLSLESYGFEPYTYISYDSQDHEKLAYLHGLLTGKNLTSHILVYNWLTLSQFTSFQGFGIKLIHGHLLLPWLLRHYPVPTIFMLRHPCAVVASQLRHLGWKDVAPAPIDLPDGLARDFPHLQGINDSIQSQEEALAFWWAINTLIPMTSPEPHPWLLLTYELLVTNGRDEVDRIFNYLDKPVPTAAYQQLRVASGSTQDSSPFAQGHSALNNWQKKLTSSQVDKILDIVHRVGIDFYDENLHPDYAKLKIER